MDFPILEDLRREGATDFVAAPLRFIDGEVHGRDPDSMTRREFLALLNNYFESVLGPVLQHQGEVLRFIGDAALAIFPVGERPAEACAKALAAARAALAGMDKLNKNRARPLRFGRASSSP